MPPGFHFIVSVDLWFPMRADSHSELPRRFDNWNLLGRLEPGWTMDQAPFEASGKNQAPCSTCLMHKLPRPRCKLRFAPRESPSP